MKTIVLIFLALFFIPYSYSQDYYQYNQYGIPQKVGTYQQNNYNNSTDYYQYNRYGIPQKVGTYQQNNYNNNTDY